MKNGMNGLDKTLIFIAIIDTLFVIAMIVTFWFYQSIPDSLVIAVFGATFGECGCCSYIWKLKREKQIKKEDTDDRSNNINSLYFDSVIGNDVCDTNP